MSKLRSRLATALLAVPLAAAASLLPAAEPAFAEFRLNPPPGVSPNGQDISLLYNLISIPAILIFLVVEIALVLVIIKFRASKNPVPARFTHSTPLEVVWTVIPAILIFAVVGVSIFVLQRDFTKRADAGTSCVGDVRGDNCATDLNITVHGYQFGWKYTYEDNGGFTLTQDGVTSGDPTALVVPVNKTIRLRTRGDDVIHSWWMPDFGVKIDAVTSYDNYSWFRVSRIGTFYGACTELCGPGHWTMRIKVQSVSDSDFQAWVREQQAKKS